MDAKQLSIVLVMMGLIPTFATQAQFVQEKKISDANSYVAYQEMNITVTESSSKTAIPADVRVKGLNPRKIVVMEDVQDTTFEIKNYRLYTVSCVQKGYMYYAEKFWPNESELHEQNVNLISIKTGLKTDVRDITFLGDKTEIYHKSREALGEIIEWLDLNPGVKIAVIGHVNGPDEAKKERFYRKASEERAQSVVNHLVKNGISESRLVVKGGGNSEMLFQNPTTDWQTEANRRIEIEVIEFRK
ncbi:MAG: outer membrane protein OmpA-like peptidoglycan-associated protein [Flavobacteriales bacterium]|jgi:outer membrane protein OmpA-like peptidoglycan-associated protein